MARALLHINGKPSVLSLSRTNPHPPSLPYSNRPMMVTMSHNQSYWAAVEADIAAHLKQAIPVRPPLVVYEPMRHLVLTAPRNTAPALCVAACELVGGYRDQAIVAASALHLMHAAAFAHEHLPSTDNRPRSKPTINHSFKPNIELLTGDGIVPFGYELLARSVDPIGDNSGRILQVILEITRAMGSQGMVDGQYLENKWNQSDGDEESRNTRWINYVCEKKEGVLHACGAACGAILGGGSEEEIEKLRRYGFYVGMIKGMLYGVGRNYKKGLMEEVEGLRDLALMELQGFNETKVETISSLVEASFSFV